MANDSPTGLWDANQAMEQTAALQLERDLGDFQTPITGIYEAGVQVPTLPARGHHEPAVTAAALFLKRTLIDLRATWILLIRGYTSPAATTAASLWEHALACTVLAEGPERVKELQAAEAGDLPWKPQQLARLGAARIESRDARGQESIEERARNIYASYRWLCKIKHPTLRSTVHDAQAAVDGSGAYVVMAAPDLRPENLPVKRMVLTIACGRSVEAVKAFARCVGCDEGHPSCEDFSARIASGERALLTIVRADRGAPLPFTLTAAEGARLQG